jgi:hypothetical protein
LWNCFQSWIMCCVRIIQHFIILFISFIWLWFGFSLFSPFLGFILQLTEWERQVLNLPEKSMSFVIFYLREYFGYEENMYTDEEIITALSNFTLWKRVIDSSFLYKMLCIWQFSFICLVYWYDMIWYDMIWYDMIWYE